MAKVQDKRALERVRIDKWLWAARFFKTRSIAKGAIEGGKVHHNGSRVKVSKEVRIGDELKVRQSSDAKVIVIKALSDKRGGALDAQLLYDETDESIERRKMTSVRRKLQLNSAPDRRPGKKDRRKISALKHQQIDED